MTACRAGGASRFDIDIQWFAAEDEGRTEEPTEQKIRRAREEGKVARSMEFSSSLVLLFGVITVGILGKYILETLLDMMSFFLYAAEEIDPVTDGTIMPAFYGYFLRLFVPVASICFVGALMGNLVQVGFLFTVKPIIPDFNRIVPNFGKFFKRAFFSGEAFFNLAKSILKIAVIGVIVYLNIRAELSAIIAFVSVPFGQAFLTISRTAFRILVEAAIVLTVLALPDYIFQRRQHLESLKMSRQEVKEERRMQEGDPLVRRRLRDRMREILTANQLQNVPRADVVITNPTHFAVALEYDRAVHPAPMVLAKGQDNMAFRIREVAKANDVTIVENKPLARTLYAEVEIGESIPEQYYEVIALILAEVYRMNGRAGEAV